MIRDCEAVPNDILPGRALSWSHPIPPTKFSLKSFVLSEWENVISSHNMILLYFFWQIPQQLASIQLLLPAMYTGLPCSDKLGLPGPSRSPKAFWCYRYGSCKFIFSGKNTCKHCVCTCYFYIHDISPFLCFSCYFLPISWALDSPNCGKANI